MKLSKLLLLVLVFNLEVAPVFAMAKAFKDGIAKAFRKIKCKCCCCCCSCSCDANDDASSGAASSTASVVAQGDRDGVSQYGSVNASGAQADAVPVRSVLSLKDRQAIRGIITDLAECFGEEVAKIIFEYRNEAGETLADIVFNRGLEAMKKALPDVTSACLRKRSKARTL